MEEIFKTLGIAPTRKYFSYLLRSRCREGASEQVLLDMLDEIELSFSSLPTQAELINVAKSIHVHSPAFSSILMKLLSIPFEKKNVALLFHSFYQSQELDPIATFFALKNTNPDLLTHPSLDRVILGRCTTPEELVRIAALFSRSGNPLSLIAQQYLITHLAKDRSKNSLSWHSAALLRAKQVFLDEGLKLDDESADALSQIELENAYAVRTLWQILSHSNTINKKYLGRVLGRTYSVGHG